MVRRVREIETVTDFILGNYYLLNLFFAVSYTSVLLIYLGHFNPENHKTDAFQRFLIGVLGWAFYDLLIWEMGQKYSAEFSYSCYRYLSFMFLCCPVLGGELVLSLTRRITWRDRIFIGGPFVILYIALILFPDLASPEIFDNKGGYIRGTAPWNAAFKVTALGVSGFLLVRLVISAGSETDLLAKREKRLLFLGGIGMIIGIVLSQVLAGSVEYKLPWMANLSTFSVSLAAFWGLHRYGRVLSPRNIYRTILRATPNGVVHIQSGRISWINQSLVNMLGHRGDNELLGHPVEALLQNQGVEKSRMEELSLLLSQGRVENEELALGEPSGTSRYFLVNGAPFDPNDPNQGALAVFTDISSHHHIQEEIRKRAKLEGVMEMSGAACHELNQPLQVIAAQLDLLQMAPMLEEKARKRLVSITEEMERLIRITKKIQRITRYKTKDYINRSKIVDLE